MSLGSFGEGVGLGQGAVPADTGTNLFDVPKQVLDSKDVLIAGESGCLQLKETEQSLRAINNQLFAHDPSVWTAEIQQSFVGSVNQMQTARTNAAAKLNEVASGLMLRPGCNTLFPAYSSSNILATYWHNYDGFAVYQEGFPWLADNRFIAAPAVGEPANMLSKAIVESFALDEAMKFEKELTVEYPIGDKETYNTTVYWSKTGRGVVVKEVTVGGVRFGFFPEYAAVTDPAKRQEISASLVARDIPNGTAELRYPVMACQALGVGMVDDSSGVPRTVSDILQGKKDPKYVVPKVQ